MRLNYFLVSISSVMRCTGKLGKEHELPKQISRLLHYTVLHISLLT